MCPRRGSLRFLYREECFVILLLNAWELLLKAIVSKSGGSIYYPKKRGAPYRTLSMTDAFAKAEKSFPRKIEALPLRGNLSLLSTYRDNAVHFYNEPHFGVLVYALSQTSVINFRDLLMEIFGKDLADDISWRLMPLGLEPPIDPIAYISEGRKPGSAVKQFLSTLASNLAEVEDAGADTGRLMTIFNISLQSVKKIEKADLVVGVDGARGASAGPLVVTKIRDPNTAYPLRQKELLKKLKTLHERPFTSNTFQAVCYKFGFKDDQTYCWRSDDGALTKYSNDIVPRIQRLSSREVEDALEAYRERAKK